jgi:hypothetical protein
VEKLTAEDIYHDRNHICGLDNWYTSIPLCMTLLKRGIHVVGTIKTNRSGFPAECKLSKKKNAQPRGHYKAMKADLPEGGTLYLTAWQDNKPVHILSTFEPFLGVTYRRARVNNVWQRVELPMPSVIAIYNSAMGGTDLCDQYTSYYEFEHRTLKWHRRIFTHFMVVAMRNAHILYLTDPKRHLLVSMRSFRTFVETVICQILGVKVPPIGPNDDSDAESNVSDEDGDFEDVADHDDDEDIDLGDVDLRESDFAPLAEPRTPPVSSRVWWNRTEGRLRRLTGRDHWPITLQKQCVTLVDGAQKRVDSRQKCYVCYKKTSTSCASCNVSLCAYGDTQLENCFFRFHNLNEYGHK